MRIKCAAIRNIHGQIWMAESHTEAYKKSYPNAPRGEQGFITDEGIFVTRVEAAEIAFSSGQIDEPKDCLFSEDIKMPDSVPGGR